MIKSLSKAHLLIIVILLALLVTVGNWIITQKYDCQRRETAVPNIPLYDNSRLLEANIEFDGTPGKVVTRSYDVSQNSTKIVDFYKSKSAICNDEPLDHKIWCGGDAEFGGYSVSIDTSDASHTTYNVNIHWHKCGDWEGIDLDNP